MIKSFLKSIIIICLISSWFGGIVYFYDNEDYQMTYRARQDKAAVNLLKQSEIYEENVSSQAVSTLFTTQK